MLSSLICVFVLTPPRATFALTHLCGGSQFRNIGWCPTFHTHPPTHPAHTHVHTHDRTHTRSPLRVSPAHRIWPLNRACMGIGLFKKSHCAVNVPGYRRSDGYLFPSPIMSARAQYPVRNCTMICSWNETVDLGANPTGLCPSTTRC